MRIQTALVLTLAVTLGACSKNLKGSLFGADLGEGSEQLAPLSQDQMSADFQALAASMKSAYGPLQFKEKLYGFNFDQLVSDTQAQIQSAKSEDERMGLFAKFLAHFHDGHLSISF